MSILIKLWLNMDIHPQGTQCPLDKCPLSLDPKGVHALTCKATGDRIRKHNSIVDFVYQQAISAAKNPIKEKLYILGQDNSKRPADIFIPNFMNDKTVCLDVGITTPMAPSHIPKASAKQLAAAEDYAESKSKKNGVPCLAQGLLYIPVCGESTGGWTPKAHDVFTYLIKSIAHRSERKFGIQRRMFYEDLSVRLQRANAMAIARRDVI